jgi:hypothetical protein
MPREFLIYTQWDGRCSTKEKERKQVHTFSDILAALAYVRRECNGEPARVTALDCAGKVTFSTNGKL